jgi:AraC-like DNA-binding protein
MQNLQQVLLRNFIPWTQNNSAERIIVARSKMELTDLPEGVKMTPRKIQGKRIIVQGGRQYGNVRHLCARWPEAGMHEAEHPFALWVAEGQVNCQVGNYFLGCSAGDLILIPPRTPFPANRHPAHVVTSNIANHSCLVVWMSLYRRGFQCWLSSYDSTGQRQTSAAENYLFLNGQVIQLFSVLLEEILDGKDQTISEGLFTAFGGSLRREVESSRFLLPGVVIESEALPADETDFTRQVGSYIQQHLNQSLTLEQVAREMYMSRTQFVRRMRKETGKTFIEFLNSYRISEAQTLLKQSEWTTHTIAQFLGFKSPTYFYALFRAQVGCTPGEYRSQHRIGKTV